MASDFRPHLIFCLHLSPAAAARRTKENSGFLPLQNDVIASGSFFGSSPKDESPTRSGAPEPDPGIPKPPPITVSEETRRRRKRSIRKKTLSSEEGREEEEK